ncbi:hypothetical protein OROGR_005419 [Orobanche gracilis]
MEFNDIYFLSVLRAELHNIPEFRGFFNPQACIDWLHDCEEIFRHMFIPIDYRVALATRRLCGRAAAWWDQLEKSRSQLRKSEIKDWQKFTKYFTRKFTPDRELLHHHKFGLATHPSIAPQFTHSTMQYHEKDEIEFPTTFPDDEKIDEQFISVCPSNVKLYFGPTNTTDLFGPSDSLSCVEVANDIGRSGPNQHNGDLFFDGSFYFEKSTDLEEEIGRNYIGPPIFDKDPVDIHEPVEVSCDGQIVLDNYQIELSGIIFEESLLGESNNIDMENRQDYDGPPVLDTESFDQKESVSSPMSEVVSRNEPFLVKSSFEDFCSAYVTSQKDVMIPRHLHHEPYEDFDSPNNYYYYFINNDSYFVGNSRGTPTTYRLKILGHVRTANIFENPELRTILPKKGGNDTIWSSSHKVNDTMINVNDITTRHTHTMTYWNESTGTKRGVTLFRTRPCRKSSGHDFLA